jgi:hypothetical protein
MRTSKEIRDIELKKWRETERERGKERRRLSLEELSIGLQIGR